MTASLERVIRASKGLDKVFTEWTSTVTGDRVEVIVSRDGGSLVVSNVTAQIQGAKDERWVGRSGIGTRVASSKEDLAFATVEAERDAFCEAAIRCGVPPAVIEGTDHAVPEPPTPRVTRTRKQKEAADATGND